MNANQETSGNVFATIRVHSRFTIRKVTRGAYPRSPTRCKWQPRNGSAGKVAAGAALCKSQGHRPWETAAHYPYPFRAPTGRPKDRPVGARKTCDLGATRCPRVTPLAVARLGLWPTRQFCHLHNPITPAAPRARRSRGGPRKRRGPRAVGPTTPRRQLGG